MLDSLVPVLAVAAPLLGSLLTGSFVVEAIFGIPGIGRFFVAAVAARDLPLALGLSVAMAVAFVTANLLVDLAVAALDPRPRDVARGGRSSPA